MFRDGCGQMANLGKSSDCKGTWLTLVVDGLCRYFSTCLSDFQMVLVNYLLEFQMVLVSAYHCQNLRWYLSTSY